jgi:hypothetical protein
MFAAVIAPAGREDAVSDVTWQPTAGGWSLTVTVRSGRHRWSIGREGIAARE